MTEREREKGPLDLRVNLNSFGLGSSLDVVVVVIIRGAAYSGGGAKTTPITN